MIEERPLLMQIQHFLRDHAMARTRFGREAVGDPRLVDDLSRGREPSERTREKVRAFIASQRAAGAPLPAPKPQREPVRRGPAPVSEMDRRAMAAHPSSEAAEARETAREALRRRRSSAPVLIAELLTRGGGAVELSEATEREWFSATFEGARHRITLSLPAGAPLPGAIAELDAAALELRGGLVVDCVVSDTGAVSDARTGAVREVIVEVLTVDLIG